MLEALEPALLSTKLPIWSEKPKKKTLKDPEKETKKQICFQMDNRNENPKRVDLV